MVTERKLARKLRQRLVEEEVNAVRFIFEAIHAATERTYMRVEHGAEPCLFVFVTEGQSGREGGWVSRAEGWDARSVGVHDKVR